MILHNYFTPFFSIQAQANGCLLLVIALVVPNVSDPYKSIDLTLELRIADFVVCANLFSFDFNKLYSAMKDLAFCIFFYFNVCICQHPQSHSSPNFLLTFICMSSSRCNIQLQLLLAVRGIVSKLYVKWVALVFLSVDNDNAFAKDPHTAFYFQTDRSADWTLDTSMLDHLIKVTLSSYPRRGFILRNATQICVLVHHL